MKRLLIIKVRPDKVGDVLLATPMIASVKAANPDLEIDVWVHPSLTSLFAHNPDVHEVGETWFRPNRSQFLSHVGKMRRYDAVWFLKDRAGRHIPASFLAGVRERVGSVRKSYGRLLTFNHAMLWDAVPVHEAELCYELAEAALETTLDRRPTKLILPSQVAERRACPETYFCVHPGTAGTSRAWSADGFAAAAAALRQATGWEVAVTGGPNEVDLCEEVRAKAGGGAVSWAGKTDLLTLAAFFKNAKGLISGSTGSIHLAATQQTPSAVVVPYPHIPEDQIPNGEKLQGARLHRYKWHPWMSPYRFFDGSVFCEGCSAASCTEEGVDCGNSIDPIEVARGLQELITNPKD